MNETAATQEITGLVFTEEMVSKMRDYCIQISTVGGVRYGNEKTIYQG